MIKYNIVGNEVTVYETEEKRINDNYTVNEILLEIKLYEDRAEVTYNSIRGFLNCKAMKAKGLLGMDKKVVVNEVLRLVQDDIRRG